MSAPNELDLRGFEAAAWRRRLWIAMYRLSNAIHLAEPIVQDHEFDDLMYAQQYVSEDQRRMRTGKRPLGLWRTCPLVADLS